MQVGVVPENKIFTFFDMELHHFYNPVVLQLYVRILMNATASNPSMNMRPIVCTVAENTAIDSLLIVFIFHHFWFVV